MRSAVPGRRRRDAPWERADGALRRGAERIRFAGGDAPESITVIREDARGAARWRVELCVWLVPGDYLVSQGTRIERVDAAGELHVVTEAEHTRGATTHWTTRWRIDVETGEVLSCDPPRARAQSR